MITNSENVREVCRLLQDEVIARRAHRDIVKRMFAICESHSFINPTSIYKPEELRDILLRELGDTYYHMQTKPNLP